MDWLPRARFLGFKYTPKNTIVFEQGSHLLQPSICKPQQNNNWKGMLSYSSGCTAHLSAKTVLQCRTHCSRVEKYLICKYILEGRGAEKRWRLHRVGLHEINYESPTKHRESRLVGFPVPWKTWHSISVLRMHVLPHRQQVRAFPLAAWSLLTSSTHSAVIQQ